MQETLEGPLTHEESKKILETFKNKKAPGDDEFTVEFYTYFFELLGNDSLVSFNKSIQNLPGILTSQDFRKAFDSIEWPFMMKTLDYFNFGNDIKHWIKIFYANTENAVQNNGFITSWFQPSKGVRQGCPLSPYLFILSAEVLSKKIRQDSNVRGIKIFGEEIKLSQFTDDTTLFYYYIWKSHVN